MLALQRIRALLNDNGWLFIEGAAASDYLGHRLAATLGLPKSRVAEVTAAIDALPLSYFDTEERIYSHWSNWFFPTTRCLEVMLRDSVFAT
jgi:hypothetical protein